MPISAKSGMGVDEVLRRVVEDLPAPRKWEDEDGKLRGLVFDTLCVHSGRCHRSSSTSDSAVPGYERTLSNVSATTSSEASSPS
jgi:hypothetical protein